MPTCIPFPPEIREVYLDFDWDRRAVWALDIEVQVLERQRLEWHLDLPFWSSRASEMRFDLTPRMVMGNPSVAPRHALRIEQADMAFALDVMEHKGRLCIMDGLHRLAKGVMEGREEAAVRRIPRSAVQPI